MRIQKSSCRLGIVCRNISNDPPFANHNYYRDLAVTGMEVHLQIIVFSPRDINWQQGTVQAHHYDLDSDSWCCSKHALPEVIYDRFFADSYAARDDYRMTMRHIRDSPKCQLLNGLLPDKWTINRLLSHDKYLQPYLPNTSLLESWQQLERWLEQSHQVIIKPRASSQGRCVLHIIDQHLGEAGITLNGRDAHNQPIHHRFTSFSQLKAWLAPFINHREFIIQSYYSLQSTQCFPYDVRALVQRTGTGHSKLTGMAVRQGLVGNVTSNLHGGGTSYAIAPYLCREFGNITAQQLITRLKKVVIRITRFLESRFSRILELGIDIGIDRDSRLWILEINAKPGRKAFYTLDDKSTYRQSVSDLIAYASYVCQQHRARKVAFMATSLGG
jgi:hypothetical protein